MNKQDLQKLDKNDLIEECLKLHNRCLKLLGENAVLSAKNEQLTEINKLLSDKLTFKRQLKKQ